jgi:hypothetical protein
MTTVLSGTQPSVDLELRDARVQRVHGGSSQAGPVMA